VDVEITLLCPVEFETDIGRDTMSEGASIRLVEVEVAYDLAQAFSLQIQTVAPECHGGRYVTARYPKVAIDDEDAFAGAVQYLL
jgi:hypothetical protein